jgi:hypothetical protein
MAIYAVIKDKLVSNVIVAESLTVAQEITETTCVDISDEIGIGIGWGYDGKKFIEPAAEPTIRPVIKPVAE